MYPHHKYIRVLLFFVCALPLLVFGQSSDVLVLKKKNHTVQRFYAGSQVSFTAINGGYRDAQITRIHNDSLYLREYLIQMIPTTAGFLIRDTLGSLRYVYHYNQVKYMGPQVNKKFNFSGSGAALFSGGILLTLGSLVVLAADKEKFSPALMYTSAGLGAFGYFLMKLTARPIEPGRHGYHFEYINMQPK